jgi:uncharacterized protein YqhQ
MEEKEISAARDEKVRLGGMALSNGVLVHGPNAWACAVRLPDGELKVVAERKRIRASEINQPLLRGPARFAEMLMLIPRVKRRLPEAQLPFERPGIMATMLGGALAVRAVRDMPMPALARELIGSFASLAPAVLALRGPGLAAYHGAEHISIGTYEHGEGAPKEHERCGSHLVGPLLATSAVGNAIASRFSPDRQSAARVVAGVGALAASTEIFSWMVRNPRHPVALALAKPGHELQHRLATAEPTAEQLEVAEAALQACLQLEHERH